MLIVCTAPQRALTVWGSSPNEFLLAPVSQIPDISEASDTGLVTVK